VRAACRTRDYLGYGSNTVPPQLHPRAWEGARPSLQGLSSRRILLASLGRLLCMAASPDCVLGLCGLAGCRSHSASGGWRGSVGKADLAGNVWRAREPNYWSQARPHPLAWHKVVLLLCRQRRLLLGKVAARKLGVGCTVPRDHLAGRQLYCSETVGNVVVAVAVNRSTTADRPVGLMARQV